MNYYVNFNNYNNAMYLNFITNMKIYLLILLFVIQLK